MTRSCSMRRMKLCGKNKPQPLQTTPDSASGVKFRLTNRWPSVCFLRITEDQLQFTLDMKKIFVLSMLISFAMICSCQKQDTAAEQQLAQRKAELDARENALDERERALAEGARAMSARTLRPAPQSGGQVRAPAQAKADPAQAKTDPAQVKAERDRRLQELPPDVKMLIPDPSRIQTDNAERDKRIQELLGQRQRRMEELKSRMSAGAASPAAEATLPPTLPPSLAASPAAEATSPSPSPTPQ